MDFEYYDKYINKETVGKYDITPIFENEKVFSSLLDDLFKPFKDIHIDKVLGLESLGFVIGSSLAQKINVGFVLVRKEGHLPSKKEDILRKCFVDYSNKRKCFEINKFSIKKGERILLVDDWIESGAQMKAAVALIEDLGGEIVGISTLCAQKNNKTKSLFEKYNLKSIKVSKESN